MLAQLRPALVLFTSLTILTGLVYPGAVTAIGQALFPRAAHGSLLGKDGKDGSELIGQPFDGEKYFRSRPSATSDAPYNGLASGGSNLGPTNQDQLKNVDDRVKEMRKAHPDQGDRPVPIDLVTASASGLDPHISPAAAEYQIARVANARGKSIDEIRRLVAKHTEGRTFGVLGEPRVNVLRLNLELDGK